MSRFTRPMRTTLPSVSFEIGGWWHDGDTLDRLPVEATKRLEIPAEQMGRMQTEPRSYSVRPSPDSFALLWNDRLDPVHRVRGARVWLVAAQLHGNARRRGVHHVCDRVASAVLENESSGGVSPGRGPRGILVAGCRALCRRLVVLQTPNEGRAVLMVSRDRWPHPDQRQLVGLRVVRGRCTGLIRYDRASKSLTVLLCLLSRTPGGPGVAGFQDSGSPMKRSTVTCESC